MVNLLPIQYKRELLQVEKQKIAATLGILGLFFLICLALVLLAVRIYIGGRITEQQTLLSAAEKEFTQPEIQALQAKIKGADKAFSALNSFYEQGFYFVPVVREVSRVLPEGVYFYDFSIVREGGGKAQISISGFAPSREILFELKKNLEAQSSFSNVHFPPSNWIKSQDVDFFVSFKAKRL